MRCKRLVSILFAFVLVLTGILPVYASENVPVMTKTETAVAEEKEVGIFYMDGTVKKWADAVPDLEFEPNETEPVPMPEPSVEMEFTDVREIDWYYDSVAYVYEKGLMTGLNSTTFGPVENLSRAQFAVILHRMNGLPEVTYTEKFPDVADDLWYTDAILWANKVGVVTGYTNTGMFGPADYITREQMALMLYRYADYMEYDTGNKADFSSFPDAGRVSGFAEEAMKWAVGNGIISGNAGKLDPQGYANRAIAATIIMRFVKLYE